VLNVKSIYNNLFKITKKNLNLTLLDHFWCNFQKNNKVITLSNPVSDHLPIMFEFDLKQKISHQNVKFRNFSNLQYDIFNQNKEELFSNYQVNENNEPNFELNRLTSFITAIVNKYFPIMNKSISVKRLNMPWIDDTVITLINKKHRLFRLLKQNIISHRYFNAYSKLLKILIAKLKCKYFNNKFIANGSDSRKSWQLINFILGRGKRSKIKTIKLMNGTTVDNPDIIAEEFNRHFSTIPIITQSRLANPLHNYEHLVPFNDLSLNLEPSTPNEVKSVLRELKKNQNASELPVKFLKIILQELSSLLSSIFNMCVVHGCWPDSLKIARIVPVFKTGNPGTVNNYRPISILPIIDKIFEKLVYVRLNNFINNCNILSNNQYGFRKSRDTQQATLKLIYSVIPALERNETAACVFLDFSKAFDTVDHKLLLTKLYRYGVRDRALNLFRSYLLGRKHFVVVNDCESSCIDCNVGVPQGSCLGPLLYILYSNDLNYLFNMLNMIMFADDTSLIVTSRYPTIISARLNNVLQKISDWCNFNKLAINPSKTKLMVFGAKKAEIPDIYLDGEVVERVKLFKYLGFNLNNRLTHKEHIAGIVSKLRRFKYISFKIGKYMTCEAAKTFYYGMVYSVFCYGTLVWGGSAANAYFKKLQSLQNTIVFNLFAKTGDTKQNVSILFKRHKILKIFDVYKIKTCVTIYNVIHNNSLPFMYDLLSELILNHNYPTRHRRNFQLPIPRVLAIKYNLLYQALKQWNSLDVATRDINNVHLFKRSLRECTFNTY
jgi:hypothetical protein